VILSHSPSEVAWCSLSHASHAPREANGITGKSGFMVVMASPLRGAPTRRNYVPYDSTYEQHASPGYSPTRRCESSPKYAG
jgi:hypothetical protein